MKGVGTSERDITGKRGGRGDVHAWEKRKGSREIYRVCGTGVGQGRRESNENRRSRKWERERERRGKSRGRKRGR